MILNLIAILALLSWLLSPLLVLAYRKLFLRAGASGRLALLALIPGLGYFLAPAALAWVVRRPAPRPKPASAPADFHPASEIAVRAPDL
ncbi:MAG: hypothetical protein AAGL49_01280, partial [Pseudomonadota bacterium]